LDKGKVSDGFVKEFYKYIQLPFPIFVFFSSPSSSSSSSSSSFSSSSSSFFFLLLILLLGIPGWSQIHNPLTSAFCLLGL
jgi:hypothetical protein